LMLAAYLIDYSVSPFLSLISRCVSLRLVAEAIEALSVVLRFCVPILLCDTLPTAFLRSLPYNYETLSALPSEWLLFFYFLLLYFFFFIYFRLFVFYCLSFFRFFIFLTIILSLSLFCILFLSPKYFYR